MSRCLTARSFHRVVLAALVLCVPSILLSGCADPNVLSLTSYPTVSLRAGQTFQFQADLNGEAANGEVAWTLQGTSGVGSITQAGLYTAPASLQQPITITVQAALRGSQVQSSTSVQVLPLVPVITAASTAVLTVGQFNVQIAGTNLLPQTTVLLNGMPETLSYSSPNTATISGTVPAGVTEASVVLQNPWDPDTSPAFSFMVEAPLGGAPNGNDSADPPPGQTAGLTGCSNPNTGTPSNDWGIGTDPVYLDASAVAVGTPSYDSNAIFWISQETAPGQSVLMTGAFTASPKTAKVALIPPGTINWKSLVTNSGTVVPTTQQGTTGLSFIVPSTFAPGVYGFEIDDPGSPAIQGLANVPNLSWAVGVSAMTSPLATLHHQVYDCGVEVGGVLDIFGKNFFPSDLVTLEAPDGTPISLTPTKIDTNSISVAIPSTLAPGTYSLWVGNPTWDATSSTVDQIVLFPPPQLTVITTPCQGLVGDGVTDNAAALQACLDENAPAAGANKAVYIVIPAGTFALATGIAPHPYEFLVGASSAQTKFLGIPNGNPPTAWITMPQHFGLVGISLTAPVDPYLVASSSTDGDPLTCGHLFLDDVRLQSTTDISNGQEVLALLSGPDVEVYDSFFLSGSNQAFSLVYGDGAIISGNEFVLDNFTGLSVSNSQNVAFTSNLTHSDNSPGQGHFSGSGLAINRANSQFGTSAVSRNIYIGYNSFEHMGSAGQQIITNDGDGGAYYGFVGNSTADRVILAGDPAWNWMGTTNPEASSIAIIAGTGVGQSSLIKSYNGRTINLVTPWRVVPNSSSIVAITQYQLNVTISHNSFGDVVGQCSICLVDSLGGVVEDNEISDSPTAGLLVGAFGPYGGPAAYGPTMNMDVLRNLTPGLGIQDMPGCLVSGMLIRGNVVPSPGVISDSNGDAGISAVLIERNQATWNQTWFYTPGFLVQDNTPSP